jgi:hypothetical protein
LREGTLSVSAVEAPGRGARVNDYYRIKARAGTKVTVEVDSVPLKSGAKLDPVVRVEDSFGRLYNSCRDPGDDHVQPPGIADPTPNAFDDLCANDDIVPGQDKNSRLEILVPGQGDSPVDLYVQVSDWNGATVPDAYEVKVNRSGFDPGR